MLAKLDGIRTYLVAGGIALATGLYAAAVIDETVYKVALGFLAPAGLAALRASVPAKPK